MKFLKVLLSVSLVTVMHLNYAMQDDDLFADLEMDFGTGDVALMDMEEDNAGLDKILTQLREEYPYVNPMMDWDEYDDEAIQRIKEDLMSSDSKSDTPDSAIVMMEEVRPQFTAQELQAAIDAKAQTLADQADIQFHEIEEYGSTTCIYGCGQIYEYAGKKAVVKKMKKKLKSHYENEHRSEIVRELYNAK